MWVDVYPWYYPRLIDSSRPRPHGLGATLHRPRPRPLGRACTGTSGRWWRICWRCTARRMPHPTRALHPAATHSHVIGWVRHPTGQGPAHCSGQVQIRPARDESYAYAALLGAAAIVSAAGCLLKPVNHFSLISPPPADTADWAAVCLEIINRCILSYWHHSDYARLTHDGSLTYSSLSSRHDNGLLKRPTLIIPTVIIDK